MRDNKLYANFKKCVFFAPEFPVLGCYVINREFELIRRRGVVDLFLAYTQESYGIATVAWFNNIICKSILRIMLDPYNPCHHF